MTIEEGDALPHSRGAIFEFAREQLRGRPSCAAGISAAPAKITVKTHRRDGPLRPEPEPYAESYRVNRERDGNSVPAISIRKAKPLHSVALRARTQRLFVPTKQYHGIIRMSVSRSKESTIRRHTASMARALTWLRGISAASTTPRPEFNAMSPVRISSGVRKGPRGASRRNDHLH
jgi:hypothetical protein